MYVDGLWISKILGVFLCFRGFARVDKCQYECQCHVTLYREREREREKERKKERERESV